MPKSFQEEVQHLDKSSKIPLYLQLYDIVYDEIMKGVWKPGDLLPSESEFAAHYDISKITVRQVFDMLAHEGLLRRQRGKGTFVTQPDLVSGSGYIYDFSMEMQSLGYEPATQVISTHMAPGSHDSALMLQIEHGAEIACIERLRLADGSPISIEETYLVHSFCPGILHGHDYTKESITKILFEKYGIRLVKAKQIIRAIAATPQIAHLLDTYVNAPILYVERVALSNKDVPIAYVRIYYRPDRYELQSELPIYQGP